MSLDLIGGEDANSDLADQEAIDLYVRKVGPAKFEALKGQLSSIYWIILERLEHQHFPVHMRDVAEKFRLRDEYHKEMAIRPLTPTQDTFKALDEEVEEKQAKNVLILEDFSEPDPYEGMSFKQKMIKRYFTLPDGKKNENN